MKRVEKQQESSISINLTQYKEENVFLPRALGPVCYKPLCIKVPLPPQVIDIASQLLIQIYFLPNERKIKRIPKCRYSRDDFLAGLNKNWIRGYRKTLLYVSRRRLSLLCRSECLISPREAFPTARTAAAGSRPRAAGTVHSVSTRDLMLLCIQ